MLRERVSSRDLAAERGSVVAVGGRASMKRPVAVINENVEYGETVLEDSRTRREYAEDLVVPFGAPATTTNGHTSKTTKKPSRVRS
jgi:hypothetical protein